MSAPLRRTLILLLFPACAVALFLAAYFFFYPGGAGFYNPPAAPEIDFENLLSQPAPAADFTDAPVFSPAVAADRGLLLVDTAHRNAFNQAELTALLSRVTGRGYSVAFLDKSSDLPEQLSAAAALLVILPRDAYSTANTAAIAAFARRGGRVLLIADPGRPHQMNALSEPLGISFRPDYLYNLTEYDTNYQEIFVRRFQADPITSGVAEIVLYNAGSIESAGPGLALPDGSTYSSLSQQVATGAPLAVGDHPNILAAYDFTFLIPPYNSVRDNDRLIANIADFLTGGQVAYRLTDYPHFFRGGVDLLLGSPDLFDLSAQLQNHLAEQGIAAELRSLDNGGRDTVFLGLYDDAPAAARYLDALGIYVNQTINAPFAAGLPREGTALLSLYRAGERDVLLILSDTPEGLAQTIDQLASGDFRGGLASDYAGVYKTE